MPETGWTAEGPDGGPALPVTGFAGFLGSMRGGPEDRPHPLTRALYAADKPDEPYDGDEVAASLMARRYQPGAMLDLNRRLGDKSAELAGELARIEKGEKVTARVRGMLERGQIGALDASRMLDGDFGDAHRAEQLERQCERLRREITEVAAQIAPAAQREPDPYEAVNRTAQAAHDVFRATTRERLAAVQARRPAARPAARPFGSVSRGAGRSTEHTGPDCWVCAEGSENPGPYPPGAVITTGYREIAR